MLKYSLRLAHLKALKPFAYLQEMLLRIEGKAAIKTGVAAGLSLSLGVGLSNFFNRPDAIVSGLWCVVASIVVMQAHLGGTYKAAWQRFFGVFIGSIIGGLCADSFGSNAFSLAISVAFTVISCSFFNIKDSVRIACLTVAVIIVLVGMRPDISPWTFGLFRFLDSCLGILVSVSIAHALWPSEATRKLQYNFDKILISESRLFKLSVTFEPMSQSDEKAFATVEEEIRGLLEESRSYLEQAKLELLLWQSTLDGWRSFIEGLETIFEAIMTVRQAPKSNLMTIFDAPLVKEFENFSNCVESVFLRLSKELNTEKNVQSNDIEEDLCFAVKTLKSNLLRFRETRATRKFSLEEIEGFYVMFYSLGVIAEELLELQRLLPQLFLFSK